MKKARVLVVGQKSGWFLRRAQEEARAFELEIVGCNAKDLVSHHAQGKLDITVNGNSIFDYDLIHLFTVQDNRSLWYAAAEQAKKRGIQIIDRNCVDSTALPSLLERLATQTEHQLPFPETTIVSSFVEMLNILRTTKRPIVLKTLKSRKGQGVTLIKNWIDAFVFRLRNSKIRSFAFREFIDADGDYRITVINGKAYAAHHRKSQNGEWRNNLSLGGKGSAVSLSSIPTIASLAEKAANIFGFDIAGVDIIVDRNGNPYILEINRSPQMDSPEKLNSINLIAEVIRMYHERIHTT